MASIKILAIVIFIIGAALRYLMNRRRFNRRNFTGAEEFKNYEHKTGTEVVEKVIKIIAWLLMIGGAFLYIIILVVDSGRSAK
jgi:hypothetical protein